MQRSYAFVIPRYVSSMGGAESLCAALGRALVADGCAVTILTTCAADNRSWANELPAGPFNEDGLSGIRFPVDDRNLDRWIPLQIRLSQGEELNIDEQLDWLLHSVISRDLFAHIASYGLSFDALFFAPYLFGTTFWGSQIHPERSILIPCLHDEAAAYLPVMRAMLRTVRGIIFNAPAERVLAERLHGSLAGGIVGMGFDQVPEDVENKLQPFFAPDERYILYLGRKETGKNAHVLIDYFCAWKDNSSEAAPVKLVICGGGSFTDLHRPQAAERDDIIDLAHVSEHDKLRIIKNALVLVQPSTNESFSIVLMEAWRLGVPVVVHGLCSVTKEHVEHSGGGLFFSDLDDFIGVMNRIISDAPLREVMGRAGKQYVAQEYSWPVVLKRFYSVVDQIFAERETRKGELDEPYQL